MRKRNLYKDIVHGAAILLLAAVCFHVYKDYQKEHNLYRVTIQSGQELTGKDAEKLQNITGLVRFEPVSSAAVTLKMEGYTLETRLDGVDLETYPLDWKKTEGEVSLGNTAALFLGEDVFQAFLDQHGFAPNQGQIKKMEGELWGVVRGTDGRSRPRSTWQDFWHNKKPRANGLYGPKPNGRNIPGIQ